MVNGYEQDTKDEKSHKEEESFARARVNNQDLSTILFSFIDKWGIKVSEELKDFTILVSKKPLIKNSQFMSESGAVEEKKSILSLKVTALLNLLNLPLYWSGIAFFIWLITEIILGFVLSPELYQRIQIIARPIIALLGPAVVGYWTNWLAIKMLFYPRERNAVWWGLIPARRDDLIEIISDEVLEKLISPQIIREYLKENSIISEVFESLIVVAKDLVKKEEFRKDVQSLISQIFSVIVNTPETRRNIREYLQRRISEWKGDSFNEKILEWSKGIWGPKVVKEIDDLLVKAPKLFTSVSSGLEKILTNSLWAFEEKAGGSRKRVEETISELLFALLHNLDIKQIVRGQLQKLKEEELERALTGNVQNELVFIQTFGGIFGLLVGLAILYPFLRLVFLGIALGLWVIYRLTLFRSQGEKE